MMTFEEFDPTGSYWLDDNHVRILHTCNGEARYVDVYREGGSATCESCGVRFTPSIEITIKVEPTVWISDEVDE